MLRVCRTYQVIKPGEWRQCTEIVHEGHTLGFVDRIRTAEHEVIRTRTLSGEEMDGECIDWLMQQPA